MRCAICYHLYNLKNVKNTHGGVLLLVKLQAKVCNFTKSNTPACVFFTFFKLYEWYQIAQHITYNSEDICCFPVPTHSLITFWKMFKSFTCSSDIQIFLRNLFWCNYFQVKKTRILLCTRPIYFLVNVKNVDLLNIS